MSSFSELVNGRRLVEDPGISLRFDSAATPVLYLGEAPVASATSSAVWRIQKIDTTTGCSITWADGNQRFDNVWDNRAGLSYS